MGLIGEAERARDLTQPPPEVAQPNGGASMRQLKFRVLDVAAMVAERAPPVAWQIDRLAVRGDVTVLTGDPGAGKSVLALALAGAVARGESIAGIGCENGSALCVDAENGRREIHRRLHSLGITGDGLTMVEAHSVELRAAGDLAGLESLLWSVRGHC